MSSANDTAGARRIMDAYNKKGSQLTEAEARSVLAGNPYKPVVTTPTTPTYNAAKPNVTTPNTNPSDADLYAGNFHENYITGNKLWVDPRVNNAQRAMIQANFYAQKAGNAAPYSQSQISGAANGGYAGYSYSPGNTGDRYSYVEPYQTGGQNWISPTQRTDQAGRTVEYRGYANEPDLGRYAMGVSSPQDMDYSWERTGGYDDLRAGTFRFNPEGAAAAAARDITRPMDVYTETTRLLDAARGGTGAGGYYDANKGYYVGAPGASDLQRTQQAIEYYRQNNMSEQLAAAQAYAQRMGYDIPSNTLTPTLTPDVAYDDKDIEQLFYQTPEGQEFLQFQQQEEERLRMEAQTLDALFAQLQGMQAEFMQYGAEGQAALAASYTQMINELNALETQLTGQIRSQMGEDDPQMIAAIGIIKEEAKKLQQSILEEMNQRGVVQSGLYYQAMENMNKGTMTEIQKMISSRVGDLQTQLNNAILNMAGIRSGIMSNYQQSLANFQSNYMQGLNNLQIAGLDATTQYQKMANDRYIANQQRGYQMDIARLNAETQRYGYDREYDIKKYLGDLGLDEIKLKGTYDLLNTQMAGEYGLKEAQIRSAAGGGGGYSSPYDNDEKLTNDMVFMRTYLDELHVKYMSNNADAVGPLYNQGRVITSIEQMPHIGPEAKEWAKNQVKLWPGVAPAAAKQRKKNNKNNTVPDVYVPIVRPSADSYFDQYKT